MAYKYQIEFWFEHGGGCLWSKNETTEEKYDLKINSHSLPISREISELLETLEDEYGTYLNWAEPNSPSLWTARHKQDFVSRATTVYHMLAEELGDEYEILNKSNESVYYD